MIRELPNKSAVQAAILKVLTGELKLLDWPLEHFPRMALLAALQEISGLTIIEDQGTTNGWDWEWSQDFQYGDKQYTLTGNGHYGGHKFFESEV